MADWEFLNKCRLRVGDFASDESYGFNGAFSFAIKGEARRIFCIASNGLGWRHVSVSFGPNLKTPSWEVMSVVRHLFYEDNEWVVQYHPPKDQNINNHPGCLHLWSLKEGKFPTPPPEMVGLIGIKSE